ncbi:MAG: SDR family NAD(P)-dependent oxidoreductase [Gemmatimonadaceae bacterium]
MSVTGDGRHSAMYAPAASAEGDAAGALRGRVCVVTGASRGIGEATARGLARRGATVIMLARDDERLSRAADRAHGDAEQGGGRVVPLVADLASLQAVRAAAQEIRARFGALHVLVNNAGVSAARRRLSADGIELTLAVNVLAPFLLAHELLPALRAGAPARIVNVASVFARWARMDFDDLQGVRHYSGDRAYLQSKLAIVLLTAALAERLRGTGISAVCVDPGLAATDLLRERWWWRAPGLRALWRRVFQSPVEAARASVLAATSPALADAGGRCVDRQGREVRGPRRWRDREAAERLWRACEELTADGG